jgi:hypothetical protein
MRVEEEAPQLPAIHRNSTMDAGKNLERSDDVFFLACHLQQ